MAQWRRALATELTLGVCPGLEIGLRVRWNKVPLLVEQGCEAGDKVKGDRGGKICGHLALQARLQPVSGLGWGLSILTQSEVESLEGSEWIGCESSWNRAPSHPPWMTDHDGRQLAV